MKILKHFYLAVAIIAVAIVISGWLSKPDNSEKAVFIQVEAVRKQVDTISIYFKKLDEYVKGVLNGEAVTPFEDVP